MIVFSPDIFQMQRYGGVSRCIYEIARRVAGRREVTIYTGPSPNAYVFDGLANGDLQAALVGRRIAEVPGRMAGALRCELPFARWIAGRHDAVVHRSYYAPIDLVPRRVPVVETLHDMMWECFDVAGWGTRANSLIKRRALERADAIACVSHNTLRDLSETWPRLAEKAVVIPHGVTPLSASPGQCDEGKPFFLYVGSREYRKNFGVLLDALADNPALAGVGLVCVGGGPWTADEQAALTAKGLEGRARQKQLADPDLVAHFEAAIALLYPSRYEGFGLPLLEAMINGCAVISSDSTSLPEVGGDAALYCPPGSVEAWRDAMARVADDDELRRDLQRRGRARAGQFTWDSAAQAYIGLYDTLSGGSPQHRAVECHGNQTPP